jgi:8-oxo-dGTP pyrophosphatase MutT (NUDIX family)
VTEAEIRRALPRGLAHEPLDIAGHRSAAVLVMLEPERGVWLTRRANHLPSHAGQVAFPGGKIEVFDASAEAAAIREAGEEIGLNPADIEILGRMDDVITGSGFHISPVISLLRAGAAFVAYPGEVEAIFCLPFSTLLDAAQPTRRHASFGANEREFWVWPHDDHLIWGATAEILLSLARRLRHA